MHESEERRAERVAAGGDAAEVLQLVEEAFDEIALSVDGFLPAVALLPIGFVGNIGDGALSPNAQTNAVCVVALVGDDILGRQGRHIAQLGDARVGPAAQVPG